MKKIALIVIFYFFVLGFLTYVFADGTQQINTNNASASNSNTTAQQGKREGKGDWEGKRGQIYLFLHSRLRLMMPSGVFIFTDILNRR